MAFTCCSPDAREQLRVSKAIDLELEQWKQDAKRASRRYGHTAYGTLAGGDIGNSGRLSSL